MVRPSSLLAGPTTGAESPNIAFVAGILKQIVNRSSYQHDRACSLKPCGQEKPALLHRGSGPSVYPNLRPATSFEDEVD